MKKSLFDFEEETTDKVVSKNDSNWDLFKQYYKLMMYSGDCDPAYPALNYVCDRLESNPNQRYWLSFLYGATYSVPSSYFFFNEFPDPENVNMGRVNRWWEKNKKRVDFQSDRKKFQNFGGKQSFPTCVDSFLRLTNKNPEKAYSKFLEIQDLEKRYEAVYNFSDNIVTFGRFTLFNFLEALNEITNLKTAPNVLNLREAESSRNGLCYACDKPEFVTLHHSPPKEPINFDFLQQNLVKMKEELQKECPELNVNFWNLETVLCAFKKLFWNDRYFGYYIDRQQEEISFMEKSVPEGVDWSLLWDFRKEYFDNKLLGELNGWKGIRKERMSIFNNTKKFFTKNENIDIISRQYKRKQKFEIIGDVYR
jgi:hypothetical protein